MKKVFFTILFMFVVKAVFAETLTLVSYYPAPIGAYRQLRLVPHDTGASPLTCSDANEGLLYYDESSKFVKFCGDDGTAVISQSLTSWVQEGSFIYPADASPNVYIGIGDITPDALLEISASSGAHDFLLLSSNDMQDGDVLTIKNDSDIGIGSKDLHFRLTLDKLNSGLGTADGGILSFGNLGSGVDLSFKGEGTRLIWYPKKSALRIGSVDNDQWDDANIGDYSLAMGYNVVASAEASIALGKSTAAGVASSAFGELTRASGPYSTAMGLRTIAESGQTGGVSLGIDTVVTGDYGIAIGNGSDANSNSAVSIGEFNVANGIASVAIGNICQADGNFSVALGQETTASGLSSLAMGEGSLSSGNYAVAMGSSTIASGNYAFSMGANSIASGNYSSVMGGSGSVAQAYASTVLGRYNVIEGNRTSWVTGDPLFVIGNGADDTTRTNSWTLFKGGTLAIGSNDVEGYALRVFGGNAAVDVTHSWTTASDVRFKKDISILENSLEKLCRLQGVTYHTLEEKNFDKKHIGFIAQEVEKEFPEVVIVDNKGYKAIDYGRVNAIAIEAIKELKGQNENMKSMMKKLSELIESKK